MRISTIILSVFCILINIKNISSASDDLDYFKSERLILSAVKEDGTGIKRNRTMAESKISQINHWGEGMQNTFYKLAYNLIFSRCSFQSRKILSEVSKGFYEEISPLKKAKFEEDVMRFAIEVAYSPEKCSLHNIYQNIDTKDVPQFPSKEDIITSLKKGPCKEVFEKYYSESNFKCLSHATRPYLGKDNDLGEDDDFFNDPFSKLYGKASYYTVWGPFGDLIDRPTNYKSPYTDMNSFLKDYDGLIYFFYSLSQIQDPKKWRCATDILGSLAREAFIKNSYSVHEYFLGISEALKSVDNFSADYTKILLKYFKNISFSMKKSINSFTDLNNVFKHMLEIAKNKYLDNFDRFMQDNNIKHFLACGCSFEDLRNIFYLSLNETPILDENQNIFATLAQVMEKENQESSMIIKSFITNNKYRLFGYSEYLYARAVPQEALKLLAMCKIEDRESCAEIVNLVNVFLSIFTTVNVQEKALDSLAKLPNPKCVKFFCDLATQHQEVIYGSYDFYHLLSCVSDGNTAGLEQSLVEAHGFKYLIKSYGLDKFLLCHSSMVDSAHWETALELTDDGSCDFSDALKCLSLIKNSAHWEKAWNLAWDHVNSDHVDSLDDDFRSDHLEAFFSFLSNHSFENWDEAVKNKYCGSSSEQGRDG